MKPLVRLFVAQSTVMCAIFSFPAGQEAGEEAKTHDPQLLNMYSILGITVTLCVLLFWIIVCCICMSWLREKDM